jgi:hypothetical protein
MRRTRIGVMDGVAGEAVHGRRVRVHAAFSRDAVGARLVTEEADLIRSGAANRFRDLCLVAARLDVLRAVAVTRRADIVGYHAPGHAAARVYIGGEDLCLVVAIRARGCLGRLCCWRGCRFRRLLLLRRLGTQTRRQSQKKQESGPAHCTNSRRHSNVSAKGRGSLPTPWNCVYRAWTLATSNSAPVPWHVAQASAGVVLPGNVAVFRNACAAASRLSWHPRQDAVPGPCGEK